MLYITAFILGCIWGSFSNVCIYRLPQNISVSKGRSYCLSCQKQIRWYDNIPLISYIILMAKCRDCSAKIDFKYFLVELISGLNFLIIFYFFGISIESLLLIILSIFFLIIYFIDLKHFIIPNELTYPLIVLGFGKTFFANQNYYIFPDYLNSIIGGVAGYTIIWVIIFLYKKLKNIEGMGLGDAKLLAAIGFWFGWIALPFVLFFSSLTALIVSVPSLIKKTKNLQTKIPFGPYIILGCVLYLLCFEKIIILLN